MKKENWYIYNSNGAARLEEFKEKEREIEGNKDRLTAWDS